MPVINFNSSRVRASGIAPAVLMTLMVIGGGCSEDRDRTDFSARSRFSQRDTVIAQGQILPAEGFIQLSATPGDVVESILVSVGQAVDKDQPLIEMRSEQVSQARLATLRLRREEAIRDRKTAIEQAQLRVAAAELKLEQSDAQGASLESKKNLLDLARQQVEAARGVLSRLESIAGNAATAEFVGQLEIERQRIAVNEAELQYRTQLQSHQQATDDLQWALKATQSEKGAADRLLAAAEASQALEILDLEIESLEKQLQASRIVAPIAGVILAINASEGEASVQLPLVEMANLDQLVCEVEINEMDAALVQVGQPARIASRAFGDQKLSGTVTQKFKLVGRPQLRPLDPLARVDYRTITATIALDEPSVAVASDWLQLHVEAEIDTSGGASAESP